LSAFFRNPYERDGVHAGGQGAVSFCVIVLSVTVCMLGDSNRGLKRLALPQQPKWYLEPKWLRCILSA
jgi:hypothetical protein